jgi:hypothetical protein
MLLGLGILAAATTLTFADRTEVRGVATSGDSAGTDQSLDIETDPELRLRVQGNHGDDEMQLYYTPRLIVSHAAYNLCGPSTTTASCGVLPNLGASYVNSPTPEILNAGGILLRHQHARTAIALIEQASYGSIDAGSLLNEPVWTGTEAPPPIFPIPKYPDINLELVTSYGGLSLYEQVTPRLDVQVQASFGVYGGPNNQSRAVFPLTENPGLLLKAEYAVTRLDDFIVSAGVDYTAVTTYVGVEPGFAGANAPLDVAPASPEFSLRGYAEVRARHHWTRTSTSELGVGAVVAYQQQQLDLESPVVTDSTTPYPMAELITTIAAAAADLRKDHTQFVAIARVQPWIDIFDGTVVQRAEGVLGSITTRGMNTFRAEVVGHYVIPTDSSPGRYRFLYGELDYARQVDPTVSIDFGLRGGAEETAEVGTGGINGNPLEASGSIYEGELFVGLRWAPTPVKL